jgi:hypothetical protein
MHHPEDAAPEDQSPDPNSADQDLDARAAEILGRISQLRSHLDRIQLDLQEVQAILEEHERRKAALRSIRPDSPENA